MIQSRPCIERVWRWMRLLRRRRSRGSALLLLLQCDGLYTRRSKRHSTLHVGRLRRLIRRQGRERVRCLLIVIVCSGWRWLLSCLLLLLLLLLSRLLVSTLILLAVSLLYVRLEMSNTTLKVVHTLHRLTSTIKKRTIRWWGKAVGRTTATTATARRRLRIARWRRLRAVVRRRRHARGRGGNRVTGLRRRSVGWVVGTRLWRRALLLLRRVRLVGVVHWWLLWILR